MISYQFLLLTVIVTIIRIVVYVCTYVVDDKTTIVSYDKEM